MRHRPVRTTAAMLCAAAIVPGLLSACAGLTLQSAPLADCKGLPNCPIELRFLRTGADGLDTADVAGVLAPNRSSISYAFDAAARSRLQWSLRGPAVRMTLAGPDGHVIGPGVPPDLILPVGGRYILSLSSNTMAEGIYGPFRLALRLLSAE